MLKWRVVLGVLPLVLLIVGVLNFALLHSLSSTLEPRLDPSIQATFRASPSGKNRVRRTPDDKGQVLTADAELQTGLRTLGAYSSRGAASGAAVIFPASPGDRTTSALVSVLRDRGLKPNFCRKDIAQCMAKQKHGAADLVWLKTEGVAGHIPEQALAGAAAVNSLGLGWKVWSRRSLCIALHLNRQAFAAGALPGRNAGALATWYPDCHTLPLKEAEAERLQTDVATDDGLWVVHGSSASTSSILPSGSQAARARGTGVMQRYVSPPMTLQGYKFSLVLYVAVTSATPLRAWLYDDGHVLLAGQPYGSKANKGGGREAHVTRLAARGGGVQVLRGKDGLLQHLKSLEMDVEGLWSNMEDAVGLAVLSAMTYTKPPAHRAAGEQSSNKPVVFHWAAPTCIHTLSLMRARAHALTARVCVLLLRDARTRPHAPACMHALLLPCHEREGDGARLQPLSKHGAKQADYCSNEWGYMRTTQHLHMNTKHTGSGSAIQAPGGTSGDMIFSSVCARDMPLPFLASHFSDTSLHLRLSADY